MANRANNSNNQNNNIATSQKGTLLKQIKTIKAERNNIVPKIVSSTANPPLSSSLKTASNSPGGKLCRLQHNYSSRNSLRTAQVFENNSSNAKQNNCINKPQMTPNFLDYSKDVPLVCTLDHADNYQLLDSECFLGRDSSDLLCMLCGSRERFSNFICDKHLMSCQHDNYLNELREELLNQELPNSSLQLKSLRELLNRWFVQNSLNVDQIQYRDSIISQFETIVRLVDPQSQCRLTGSSLSGTSLNNSPIELELLHPNSKLFETEPRAKNSIHHKLVDPDADFGGQINLHTLHYDLISNAVDSLYKIMTIIDSDYQGSPIDLFKVVSSSIDLNKRVPKLRLLHLPSNIPLTVSCYSRSFHKLSVLLKTYTSLDARACILSILVKHWSNICKINDSDLGTFTDEIFMVLIIHYLQRTTPPILPCLHELLCPKQKTSEDAISSITARTEELTIDAEDDLENELGREETYSSDPFEDGGQDESYISPESEEVKSLNWKSKNTSSIEQLFIGFLRAVTSEFSRPNDVISIRTLKRITMTKKGWTTQVKSIENPISPDNNMTRCIATLRTFNYIKDCFKTSAYYLTSIPLDHRLKSKTEFPSDPSDFSLLYVHKHRQSNYFHMRKSSLKNAVKYDPILEMIRQNIFAKDVEVIYNIFSHNNAADNLLPSRLANCYNENFFTSRDLIASSYCWSCRNFGHSKLSCSKNPIEKLREEFDTYDINLDTEADFDSALNMNFIKHSIKPELKKQHENLVNELCDNINSKTALDCKLQLFGSTVNGLGSIDSDLDICLTLANNTTGKGVDCVEVLERVQLALSTLPQVKSIEPILSARVPIIKFQYLSFDIDLSMYNLCALYNSKLLKAYSSIDPRVAKLFYLVKRYAKACEIADASKGSLSSYAWSLLVIHYLQHTNPPILPVLQEADADSRKTIMGVNGWNVWFNEKFKTETLEKNSLTMTQLLKGFFLYYGNFDFNLYVISIRKSELFTKYQKSWNSCMMAIEDPFELTYNLASRLDDGMSTYIINSFAQAFRHIIKIQRRYLDSEQKDLKVFGPFDKIFNGRAITGSSPPQRGCRLCSKIGHKLADCPKSRKNTARSNGANGASGANSRNGAENLKKK